MKESSIISQKQKHRLIKANVFECYFVTNKSNKSWIISKIPPTKVKTVTSPKLTSPSTPDEISIFDDAMLSSKRQ